MTAAEKKKKYNFWVMMGKLVKSKMYIVGTLTMSIILFVSTGIQFWLTDYFVNVLGFNREQVNVTYAVVSLTGPTIGCAFGTYYILRRWLCDQQDWRIWLAKNCLLCIHFLLHWNWSSCGHTFCRELLFTFCFVMDCTLFWRSNDAWPHWTYDVFSFTLP